MKRREDLSTPRAARTGPRVRYDADTLGQWSETVARFFGTARFLAIQTVIVAIWLIVNATAAGLRWDPYPFILLNLMFSVQAAYAAPFILLAQTRQERRDRVQAQRDRDIATRTQDDTEFLAREIAGVRLMLADAPTGGELRDELRSLTAAVERISARLDEIDASRA